MICVIIRLYVHCIPVKIENVPLLLFISIVSPPFYLLSVSLNILCAFDTPCAIHHSFCLSPIICTQYLIHILIARDLSFSLPFTPISYAFRIRIYILNLHSMFSVFLPLKGIRQMRQAEMELLAKIRIFPHFICRA